MKKPIKGRSLKLERRHQTVLEKREIAKLRYEIKLLKQGQYIVNGRLTRGG